MRKMLVLGALLLGMPHQAQAFAEGAEAEKIATMLKQLEQVTATCVKAGKPYGCADAAAAIGYRYELSGAHITTAAQFVQQIAPDKEYQMQFAGGRLSMTTTEFLREALQQLEAGQ